ncbi:MAG: tRNA dihydrouridine synthase DusB [Desulfobacterales bacterium]
MKIGSLELGEKPVLFAPLAGITHAPARLLAREAGCPMAWSEMVSAEGLVRRQAGSLGDLKRLPGEDPVAIQIFGADPKVMAEAARIVADSGAAVIDINAGCAVRKVVRQGAGVALMREPDRMREVLRAVRRAVRIPITLKIRSGWEPGGVQALKIGQIAQDCGVDAVILHPRTATQRFAGKADWAVIARLKGVLSIPVIGNGDIRTPEDARRMLTETGCDAVMVGRRAVGDPHFFRQVREALDGRPVPQETPAERLARMRRYIELAITCHGEETAYRLLRTRLPWFTRNLPGAAALRRRLAACRRLAAMHSLLGDVHSYIAWDPDTI